jgi:hypothetical protein
MPDTFGLSFAPLDQPNAQQQPNGGAAGGGNVSPVQQAIQILSLRQPRVFGASAPAAPQLLTSAGGSGVPDMQALLRALLQHLQGQVGLSDPGMGALGGGGGTPGGGSANTLNNPLANVFGMPNAGVNVANTTTAPAPKIDVNKDEVNPVTYPDAEETTQTQDKQKVFFGGGIGNTGRGKNREY